MRSEAHVNIYWEENGVPMCYWILVIRISYHFTNILDLAFIPNLYVFDVLSRKIPSMPLRYSIIAKQLLDCNYVCVSECEIVHLNIVFTVRAV